MINVRGDKEQGDKRGALNQGTGNPNVYVGNLTYEVNWQELKTHMSQAGQVVRADILIGPDKRSRGCGVVEVSIA